MRMRGLQALFQRHPIAYCTINWFVYLFLYLSFVRHSTYRSGSFASVWLAGGLRRGAREIRESPRESLTISRSVGARCDRETDVRLREIGSLT